MSTAAAHTLSVIAPVGSGNRRLVAPFCSAVEHIVPARLGGVRRSRFGVITRSRVSVQIASGRPAVPPFPAPPSTSYPAGCLEFSTSHRWVSGAWPTLQRHCREAPAPCRCSGLFSSTCPPSCLPSGPLNAESRPPRRPPVRRPPPDLPAAAPAAPALAASSRRRRLPRPPTPARRAHHGLSLRRRT